MQYNQLSPLLCFCGNEVGAAECAWLMWEGCLDHSNATLKLFLPFGLMDFWILRSVLLFSFRATKHHVTKTILQLGRENPEQYEHWKSRVMYHEELLSIAPFQNQQTKSSACHISQVSRTLHLKQCIQIGHAWFLHEAQAFEGTILFEIERKT